MEEKSYVVTQIVLAISMLIVTSIAGMVPLLILRIIKGTDRGWLSYLSCFSGGVFMATCFLDILPHINRTYARLAEHHNFDDSFPVPSVVICGGFFLVYLIEHVTSLIFSQESCDKDKSKRDVMTISSEETPAKFAVEETISWISDDKADHTGFLKAMTFAVAISFHSLLEGFALGVQESSAAIYALFFSLLIHKAVEAFGVGIQISKGHGSNKVKIVAITILIYALMTPIGSILGTVLLNSEGTSLLKEGAMLLLESLAAGTFVYVTFIEILAYEKSNRFNKMKQLVSIISGFLLICCLQYLFTF